MSPETNMDGALAAALAKAQGEFPAIPRDKEVTVQTKTGGSYKFKYAPLDSILNAVRKPLADNGLAITQLLDAGDLVTMLLHRDGASLSGRVPLPGIDGIQAFGSAITYLRRYSIQAILGIAAEEDDDGNHASGNTATYGRPRTEAPKETLHRDDGSLVGTAEVGKGQADFELRQTPNGMKLEFRLTSGRGGIKVVAIGPLAEALAAIKETVIGQRVTCWGTISDETFRPKGSTKDVTYQVLTLTRIQTPDATLPAQLDEPPLEEPPPDLELIGEVA